MDLVYKMSKLQEDIATKRKELDELLKVEAQVKRLLGRRVPTPPRVVRASRRRNHNGLMGAVWASLQKDRKPVTSTDLAKTMSLAPTAAAGVLCRLYQRHARSLKRIRKGRFFVYQYVG